MQFKHCLSPLSYKLRPVGPGYSPVLILELGTHVSRVVVVGLSCDLRVFLWVLRFSSLRKINT